MASLINIKKYLLEDNVRYLPTYALLEIVEELRKIISEESFEREEEEILREILYLLKLSPHSFSFLEDFFTYNKPYGYP